MNAKTPTWSIPQNTRTYRRYLYLRHQVVTALFIRKGYSLRNFGERETGCSWDLCTDGLSARSIVYSGGVGFDIAFEQALVKEFGCTIHLFDPSPSGQKTMSRPENTIPQLVFHPIGLSGRNETLKLAPPIHAEEGSWFAHSDMGTIEVPCLNLATILKQNGHDHIDLLKLDIEGAEYGVIDQFLESKIPVRQLLVEYHHDLVPGISLSQGIRSAYKLMRAGYKMICEAGNSYTFIR